VFRLEPATLVSSTICARNHSAQIAQVAAALGRRVLSTRSDATQNACEVIILIEPNHSLTIGECNLNHIENHLWVNLPCSHVSNLQSVLWP
jgi:hypothetical protein